MKYCGGCTPRYNRVQAVRYIRKRLNDEVVLVSYEDHDIEGILIVAGCPTVCVDLAPFKGLPVWVVTSFQDAEYFVQRMRSIWDQKGL